VGFEPIILVGSVVVSFKDFGRGGPKGLRADIGSLKGSELIDVWLAKKFLLISARRGI
jgi:hypothetical protein